MDSLKATDAASAAVAVAPRVKLEDIVAAIALRYDTTAHQATADIVPSQASDSAAAVIPALRLLSICILVMKNGFVVMGESAPASPENFDRELGKKFAYENAIRKLWPLMGFALRDRLTGQ